MNLGVDGAGEGKDGKKKEQFEMNSSENSLKKSKLIKIA